MKNLQFYNQKAFVIFRDFHAVERIFTKNPWQVILNRAKNFNCFGVKQIFLEIILMIQSWVHTNRIQNGSPAIFRMRLETSLCVDLCAGGDESNYQPKHGGLDRCEFNI